MALAFKKYRFTSNAFMRMDEVGIIDPELRCELIEGEIVEMPPINPPHAANVDRINHRLQLRLRDRAIVRVQSPILLDNHSVPIPDIALVAPRADFYETSHPDPQTIYLVIEVADTTLDYDLEAKSKLYAEAGIPQYWVVDVNARRIHLHMQPLEKRYAWCLVQDSGTIRIDALSETFDVAELLG